MFDHWSRLAPHYERMQGAVDPAPLRKHLNLPIAGRLLDAGGGTGRVAKVLCDQAGQTIVCDAAPGMVEQAARKLCLQSVQAPAELLPFADAAFERIIVVDAFHHFADHQAALACLWRVLAPGGRLVIEEPNINVTGVKIVALVERLMLMRSRFFSPQDMSKMLASLGAGVTLYGADRFDTWVIADKAAK